MNRRWQKDGVGRYESLPSLSWLVSQLPPLPFNLGLADTADIYSLLSALHAKRRNPTPAACLHGGFYFFMADQPQAALEPSSMQQTGLGRDDAGGGQADGGVVREGPATAPLRREPVVPVSSKHPGLTMQLLFSLFSINGPGTRASHILLALVDDDGSVSLMRCFARIQPPYEGPGVLPDALEGDVDDPSNAQPNDSADDEG